MNTAKRKSITVKEKPSSKTAAAYGSISPLKKVAINSDGKGYAKILRQVVAVIKHTRVIVANRVNSSTIQMYWDIGKYLSGECSEKGYGSAVVKRLSIDLKTEFPDIAGFSSRNLWDMKRFYEFYKDEKLRQLSQFYLSLSWGHHLKNWNWRKGL